MNPESNRINSSFQSLDELIFDGRNQSFGAFLLRIHYPERVLRALWITLSGFSLALLTPKILESIFSGTQETVTEVTTVDPRMIEPPPIDPKTPPPPPLPASPPPPKVSTVRFVPPEVAPDEEILEEDPPKQEELKEVQSAAETIEGDPNADPNEMSLDVSGSGDVIGGAPEPDPDETFLLVDQMPSFPEGDVQAFFARNLRYTNKALSKEITGKVFVSFVVMPDGKISDIQLLKGLGYGLDEEALRVVKSMPDWIPGKQAGRPVKVKIIQPIRFSL